SSVAWVSVISLSAALMRRRFSSSSSAMMFVLVFLRMVYNLPFFFYYKLAGNLLTTGRFYFIIICKILLGYYSRRWSAFEYLQAPVQVGMNQLTSCQVGDFERGTYKR